MIKKLWKNQKGFTLMEIIIVIVILGILAMIAIPRLIGFTSQAEIASDKEYAAVAARAAELYWAANDKPATVAIGDLDYTAGAKMIDNVSALQYFTGASISMGTGANEGIATVTLTGGAAPTETIAYNSKEGYKATPATPATP